MIVPITATLRYSATSFVTHPMHVTILLSHLLSTNTLNLSTGMVSSILTKDGLIRFPSEALDENPNAKSGTRVVAGLLKRIEDKYDWAREILMLNAIQVEQVGLLSTLSLFISDHT